MRGRRTRKVHRDPVELSLRRIFHGSVACSLLGASSLATGCSVTGLDEALEDQPADDEDYEQDEESSTRSRDAGRRRDDRGVDAAARGSTRVRDAAARDARVLLDARLNNDASSQAPDAGALPCSSGFPVRAAFLRPLEGYDYIAVREASELAVLDPDAGIGSWSSSAFRSLSEVGMRCSRAVGASCSEKVEKHPLPLANPQCTDHCFERAVVTTRGDEVKRWSTPAELVSLFGPIDSPDEALMLVSAEGFWLTCGDAAYSSIRELSDGYEVFATRNLSLCPVKSELVRLYVSLGGKVNLLGTTPLPAQSSICVGRVPAGLTSRSVERHDDALGDFLAQVAHLEAASVHAFERLARELFAHGAPQSLVRDALRAAADEVRHARVMGELAQQHGGELVPVEVAKLPTRSLEEIAIENATEGCVRETFGALVGAYQAEYAESPALRAAMRTIAKDEARHAALSHRVHAWALAELPALARVRVGSAQQAAIAALLSEQSECGDEAVARRAGLPPAEVVRAFVAGLERELWGQALAS